MKIEKKVFKNIDYRILLSMFAITTIGIITISSATKAFSASGTNRDFYSQILWLFISCGIGFIVLLIDYNTIGGYYKILYSGVIIMLVVVLVAGTVRNNAKSWLGIGSLGIQPSEFAKLVLIITLAKIMEEMENINTLKNLSKIAIICIIPMGLIQLQPDLGTNIIFVIHMLIFIHIIT